MSTEDEFDAWEADLSPGERLAWLALEEQAQDLEVFGDDTFEDDDELWSATFEEADTARSVNLVFTSSNRRPGYYELANYCTQCGLRYDDPDHCQEGRVE